MNNDNGKTIFSFAKAFFVVWLVWATIVMTGVGLLIWAAVHFISKYW